MGVSKNHFIALSAPYPYVSDVNTLPRSQLNNRMEQIKINEFLIIHKALGARVWSAANHMPLNSFIL